MWTFLWARIRLVVIRSISTGCLTLQQEEDFEYDDGVYADLDLDKYIEADLDDEGTVASDVENDGNADSVISSSCTNKESDLLPRSTTRKSIGKMEEEDSPDVSTDHVLSDGMLTFLGIEQEDRRYAP
jgi:hypothetical protein